MALEPAGVSLEAEGFAAYLKKLNDIDKKQQKVFDTKFKDTQKSFVQVTAAAKKYEKELKDLADAEREAQKNSKKLALSLGAGVAGAAIAATAALIELGKVGVSVFIDLAKRGIVLNQGIEDTEKIFSNLFRDQGLAEATVDIIGDLAAQFRVARSDALSFGQSILPRTSNLDTFKELLRLTDIQADTTGKTFQELSFSIKEALSGDFVSLKDQFDVSNEVVNRIKELAPAIGQDAALAKALGEEFERLGKTDLSGTLTVGLKDLQTQADNLNTVFGEAIFDQAKIQVQAFSEAIERNEEGLKKTAIGLGLVASNALELIGTELVQFLDSLDFKKIEKGIGNLNAFVEALRTVVVVVKEAASTGVLQTAFGLLTGNVDQVFSGLLKIRQADFGESFAKIDEAVANSTRRQDEFKSKLDEAANAQNNVTQAQKDSINSFLAENNQVKQTTESITALNNALKQAAQLQLSFARAAEDAARQLARQQEDVARNQARQVGRLQENQAKAQADLLNDQIKELERFEENRRKQIANAEAEAAKERQKAQADIKRAQADAARDRIRAQEKLQRELQQALDRFNLSQLQSERRFQLSEKRLRAEGDILGLQQLREDQELARQEEKENFALQQKETKDDVKETTKDQGQDLEDRSRQINQSAKERINDLKASLEQQRAELLTGFDQQIADQLLAQSEARVEQQRGFSEQAEDRSIALQRAEEDRRISEQRQLEDLGRSLASQKDLTEEGVAAIAGEIEKVFGQEGVADTILSGFATRTESGFATLFGNVADIISSATMSSGLPSDVASPGRIGGIPEFHDGGVVPGPAGSPQIIQALGKETVLPTHKQSFIMPAPVVPSQTLSVEMSGGFNISGGEGAPEGVIEAAVVEMADTMEITMRRLTRRSSI